MAEDKYFGEYKTKSKHYIVKYRDFIAVDGDLMSNKFPSNGG